MTMSLWIQLISLIVNIGFFAVVIYYCRRITTTQQRAEADTQLIIRSTTARQGQVNMHRAAEKRPDADSRSVTTRRDTADLPATGRVSRISSVTRRGGSHDRSDE